MGVFFCKFANFGLGFWTCLPDLYLIYLSVLGFLSILTKRTLDLLFPLNFLFWACFSPFLKYNHAGSEVANIFNWEGPKVGAQNFEFISMQSIHCFHVRCLTLVCCCKTCSTLHKLTVLSQSVEIFPQFLISSLKNRSFSLRVASVKITLT